MKSATLIEIEANSEQLIRLQALYQMAVELSSLRSLKSVLDAALGHCLDLTDSQFGFIGLNKAGSKALDVVAIQGFHPSEQFYQHNHLIPLRPNLFARAILENRSVRTDDAMHDPHRVGQPKGHPPVETFLGVPLRIRNKPIGMIGVANRPEPYAEEHEQLLMTYAAQVAIVIRNAQLYEQLQQTNEALEEQVFQRTQQLEEAKEALARKADQLQHLLAETVNVQEHERQRIAQDMHDGTNQLIIGAMLELKSARQRLGSGDLDRTTDSMKAVQSILRRVEAEIKRVIYNLGPPTLDALGLAPALRRYVEQYEAYTGVRAIAIISGNPIRLPSNVEISVYRLLQESLQNINTHAQATCVEAALIFTPEQLQLTVTDDGRGFDPKAIQQKDDGSFVSEGPFVSEGHLGLIGMRERAESMGGRITINSQPGQGTKIELVVPIT